MSTVVEVQSQESRPQGRSSARLGVLSGIAVAVPVVVVAVVQLASGTLVLGGDQALIGLDALDARHLDQGVGSYSRMGWAHPGPAWTYLLAPLWWVLGSTGQALVAASLAVHALFAVLVVVAAGGERPWQRPLVAAVVLLYVLRMPAIVFVNVWNPFALLLPTFLLCLVAARACAGSLASFATVVLVASFLLQTHVGTVPLVGLVGLVVVVATGLRLVRGQVDRPDRAGWTRVGLAVGGVVLIWVPPLWQQLSTASSGQGNLGMLADYFTSGGDPAAQTHTWAEAFSSVGQLLGASVFGWPATPGPVDTTILTAAVVCAVLVQLGGGVAVAVLAFRAGATRTGWLAVLTAVAVVAGLVAGRTVTGELQNYLLLWVTVLPPALLVAGASLVLHRWPAGAGTSVLRVAAIGTVAAVVLAVGVGLSLERSADTQLGSQPAAEEAGHLLLDALPDEDSTVLLDIADVGAWTTATSVALDLELAGHRVSVEETWVYSFGQDRRSDGDEEWIATLVPITEGQPALPGQLGVVAAINGPTAVLLERAPAG
ncbi:hypothetical protein [Modestobacter lacusdianchii]